MTDEQINLTFGMLCPVCATQWSYEEGGQHVGCIRDRHIVEAHPDHAFALVVLARREMEAEESGHGHRFDECPEVVDVRAYPEPDAQPDPGPFDFSPSIPDPIDLDITAEEWILFNLVGAAAEHFGEAPDG